VGPVISTLLPPNGPTLGGLPLTIQGHYLTASTGEGEPLAVHVYGTTKERCEVVTQSANNVVCTLPAGQPVASSGHVLVEVSAGSQTSNNQTFVYDAPVISALSPSSGPQLGHFQVAVRGRNFGLQAALLFADEQLVPVSQNHTDLVFTVPSGAGTVSVEVSVSGRIASATFSYLGPRVTSVEPPTLPTQGGALTIHGENFGASSDQGVLSVWVAGSQCMGLVRGDGRLTCMAPAGAGLQPLEIRHALYPTVSTAITYDGPRLTSLSPGSCSSPPVGGGSVGEVSCPVGGGSTITIHGENFGVTTGSVNGSPALTVTIGGKVCTSPAIDAAHSRLRCTVPAGFGFNLPVLVARGSQVSNALDTFSYVGPYFVRGTLKPQGGNVVLRDLTAFVDVPSTHASMTLLLTGNNFMIGGMPKVYYGFRHNPLQFPCTTGVITPTSITCSISGGVGRSVRFTVVSGLYASPMSDDVLHFPAPVMTEGSLAIFGVPETFTELSATSTQGDLISLQGNHFGTWPSEISVSYSRYGCVLPANRDPPSSNTLVVCKTGPGAGANLRFSVTVGQGEHAQTYLANSSYTYPVSPEVLSVTGCQESSSDPSVSEQCPTEGGTRITLNGLFFGSFPTVTVAGKYCLEVLNDAVQSERVLTCTLPAGTGSLQLVTVRQGIFFSRAKALVSYARPVITSVRGCKGQTGNDATDCLRAGGDRLTIHGQNFGAQNAKVVVGGVSCTNVQHDASTPHRLVTCSLAAGTGLRRSVTMFQEGGEPSTDAVFISYEQCPPGSYADGLGCQPCSVGQYSSFAGQEFCFDCPSGTFAASSNTSSCAQCPGGRYAPLQKQSTCVDCPPGTYSTAEGTVQCLACPVGSYSPSSNSTTCLSCDPGFFQNATSSSFCYPCLPGSVSSSNQPTCHKCNAGTYAASSSMSSCLRCPVGTRSAEASGSSACSDCAPGTYSSSDGRSVCARCAAGSFNDATRQAQCISCPVATFMELQNATACLACTAGTFASKPASIKCEACAVGHYSLANARFCTQCPRGSFQSTSGSSHCLLCSAGFHQGSLAQAACIPCPAGHFQPNANETACVPCAPGNFTSVLGSPVCQACPLGRFATNAGLSSCLSCASGTYLDVSGASICKACAAGKHSFASGQSSCSDCPAGTYSNVQASECTACVGGKYSSTNSSHTCLDCQPGHSQSSQGASFCSECSPGTMSDSTGNAVCRACPVGTFSNSSGRTECVPCSAGFYADSLSGATACLLCQPGYYSDSAQQSKCQACSAGAVTGLDAFGEAVRGASLCQSCPVGTYRSTPGGVICDECPPGSVYPSSGASSCFSCESGTYSNQTGGSVCVACEAGTYADHPNSPSCVPCPLGAMCPQSSMTAAQACSVGRFTATVGQTACETCSSGRHQSITSQSGCSRCAVGRFIAVTGAASCSVCPAGKHAPLTGQSQCQDCQEGYFSGSGASTCESCEPGSFSSMNNSAQCSSCSAGYYAPTIGMTSCLPCQAGEHQNSPSASSCIPCAPGKVNSIVGSINCVECASGRFSAGNGSATCTECPPGSRQPSSGQSACIACPVGHFQTAFAQIDCVATSPGYHAPQPGATEQVPCALGHYQPQPGESACVECSPGYFARSNGSALCQMCEVGRYAERSGQASCEDCPPGFYQYARGHAECTPCAVGFYIDKSMSTSCMSCEVGKVASSANHSSCVTCPAGTFQNLQMSSTCLSCEKGSYSLSPGSSACVQCEAGKFSNGSQPCMECEAGRYSDQVASSTCMECGAGKYSNANAQVCIPCAQRTANPFGGSSACYACSEHATSSEDRLACICQAGYYASPPNDDTGRVECLACPRGSICNAPGQTIASLRSVDGWWRESNASLSFYRCLLPAHCGSDIEEPCKAYRTGPLCSLCIEGYRSQSGISRCQKCPERSTSLVTTILLCIAIFIGVLCLFYLVLWADGNLIKQMEQKDKEALEWDQHDTELAAEQLQQMSALTTGMRLSSWAQDGTEAPEPAQDVTIKQSRAPKTLDRSIEAIIVAKNHFIPHTTKDSRHAENVTFKLKILLGFVQIIMNMAFVLDVEWPRTYTNFIAAFSFINLDFVPWQSVGCVTAFSYYTKLGLIALLPLLLTLALFVCYLLPRYFRDYRTHRDDPASFHAARKRSRRRFWKLLLFTLFCIYPNVSSSLLGYFVCRDINGTTFLLADFSLECYDSRWMSNLPWIIVAILVYPIGVPAFFFYILRRYRQRMDEPGVRMQLGFLYAAYNRDSWYFELCDMANKLTMVALLAFLPPAIQMEAALFVCGVFFCVLVLKPPFVRLSDDALHVLAEVEIFLVVLAALVMSHQGTALDDTTDVLLSLIFIMLAITLFVIWLALTLKGLYYIYRKYDLKAVRHAVKGFFGMNSVADEDAEMRRRRGSSYASPFDGTPVVLSTKAAAGTNDAHAQAAEIGRKKRHSHSHSRVSLARRSVVEGGGVEGMPLEGVPEGDDEGEWEEVGVDVDGGGEMEMTQFPVDTIYESDDDSDVDVDDGHTGDDDEEEEDHVGELQLDFYAAAPSSSSDPSSSSASPAGAAALDDLDLSILDSLPSQSQPKPKQKKKAMRRHQRSSSRASAFLNPLFSGSSSLGSMDLSGSASRAGSVSIMPAASSPVAQPSSSASSSDPSSDPSSLSVRSSNIHFLNSLDDE